MGQCAVNEAMSVVQAELVRQMERLTFDKLAVREKEILETMNPFVSHA